LGCAGVLLSTSIAVSSMIGANEPLTLDVDLTSMSGWPVELSCEHSVEL